MQQQPAQVLAKMVKDHSLVNIMTNVCKWSFAVHHRVCQNPAFWSFWVDEQGKVELASKLREVLYTRKKCSPMGCKIIETIVGFTWKLGVRDTLNGVLGGFSNNTAYAYEHFGDGENENPIPNLYLFVLKCEPRLLRTVYASNLKLYMQRVFHPFYLQGNDREAILGARSLLHLLEALPNSYHLQTPVPYMGIVVYDGGIASILTD